MSLEFSSQPRNPEQPLGKLEANDSGALETRLDEERRPSITLLYFLRLAKQGDWDQFDATVFQIRNDPAWLQWATEGIEHPEVDIRDLAISILERTSKPLLVVQLDALMNVLSTDANLHLRRKAAITLFIKGTKSKPVINQLQEARENDPELREQVLRLLLNVRI